MSTNIFQKVLRGGWFGEPAKNRSRPEQEKLAALGRRNWSLFSRRSAPHPQTFDSSSHVNSAVLNRSYAWLLALAREFRRQ